MKDEPQHALMGRITGEILTSMGIPWEPFPDCHDKIDDALGRADEYMSDSSLPYAFIMAKASVAAHPLKPQAARAASELAVPVAPHRPHAAGTGASVEHLDGIERLRLKDIGPPAHDVQ